MWFPKGVGGVMVECEDDSYSEEMEKAERAVEWKMVKKCSCMISRCERRRPPDRTQLPTYTATKLP